MHYHFRDFDATSNEIELKRCPLDRLRRLFASEPSYLNLGVEHRGPTLPFQKISCLDYRSEQPFDYVFFARSPEFTPIESDLLLPICQEYIEVI